MKAKFSLSDLFIDSKLAVARFVIPILLSILGAGIAIYSFNGKELSDTIISLLITVGLGISLFFALAIFFENRKFSKWIIIGAHLTAAIILVCIFFQLHQMQLYNQKNIPLLVVRYAIIFHLLVSFLPFLGNKLNIGFWHYNRILFTRILLTAIFIATVYLGLAAALGAISELFGTKIEPDVFFDLWAICFGPVSVIFFCAGVPNDLRELETTDEYSNILRIFVQFVLIPLVIIYLVIMYAYFGKIVIEANLPKGFLTYFVHAMMVLGMFAYLLIYPFQYVSNSKTIRFYTKLFFIFLIPVIAMQLVGIITRINQYGFTEERYLVLATALCVVSMIVYYVVLRKKNLIFIPAVIFVFTLISVIGPFSATNITIWSRKNRIEQMVTEMKMFDGKTLKPFKKLTKKDAVNIKQSNKLYKEIEYMVDEYDITGLEPYLKIKSCQQINNDLIEASKHTFVRTDRRSYYQLKNIQREELNSKLFKLNISNNDLDFTSNYNLDEETVIEPATFKSIEFPIDCKLPFGVHQMTDIVFYAASDNKMMSTVLENNQFEIIKNGKKYIFDFNSIFQIEENYPSKGIFFKDMQPNSKAVFVVKYVSYTLKNMQIDEIKGILCE